MSVTEVTSEARRQTRSDVAAEWNANPHFNVNGSAATWQKAGLTPAVPVWRVWLSCFTAAIMMVAFAPIIAISYLLVRLTSKGPGFYFQKRMGLHSEDFYLIKLRTMYVDAESRTGPVWAKKDDPRVTPLGYWLRKLHLDELPQLFNVLRGEMGFVGPRPERPELAAKLVKKLPDYYERLNVRPGITGLAQINLPPDVDIESVRRKLALDREYAATSSLTMDICIILGTLPHVLGMHSKTINRLLGVHRHVPEIPTLPKLELDVKQDVDEGQQEAQAFHAAQLKDYYEEAIESMTAADLAVKRLLTLVSSGTDGSPSPTQSVLDLAHRLRESQSQQEAMLLQSLLHVGLSATQESYTPTP